MFVSLELVPFSQQLRFMSFFTFIFDVALDISCFDGLDRDFYFFEGLNVVTKHIIQLSHYSDFSEKFGFLGSGINVQNRLESTIMVKNS